MTNKTTDIDTNNSTLAKFYTGDDYVIEESMGYLLKHAQLALHRTLDGKMAELDLTALQWAPLLLLAIGNARTAADLSRCSGVETSTMTRMLDRIESKGLITRRRCEKDRRIIYLELTETGKALAVQVPYLLADSFNHHLRGFSKEEVDTLKSLLRRIRVNEES